MLSRLMNKASDKSSSSETFGLEFDGASRGNPGPAGAGYAIRAQDGTVVFSGGEYHPHATNNFAEYRALIAGLKKAVELNIQHLDVRGDSQLVIRQMLGQYKVKHPNMIPLYQEARSLVMRMKSVSFTHTFREGNTLADKLSNVAIDKKGDPRALADAGA